MSRPPDTLHTEFGRRPTPRPWSPRHVAEAVERLMCMADLRATSPLEAVRFEMYAGLWCEDRATAIAMRARHHVHGIHSSELAAQGWTMVIDIEREAAGLLLAGWRP